MSGLGLGVHVRLIGRKGEKLPVFPTKAGGPLTKPLIDMRNFASGLAQQILWQKAFVGQQWTCYLKAESQDVLVSTSGVKKVEFRGGGPRNKALILDLKDVRKEDTPLVGGKASSLGEMIGELSEVGVNVPGGFVTTREFYDQYMESSGLKEKIMEILEGLDISKVEDLQKRGTAVRKLILETEIPKDLANLIITEYKKMGGGRVAIRSSATAEDLKDASFAGQQDTYLEREGEEEVLRHVRMCIASLFTDRAISYRTSAGFDHFKVALCVIVQRMVPNQKGAGVSFSIHPDSQNPNVLIINAVYGLGEKAVGGENADEILLSIPALKAGKYAVIERNVKVKKKMLVASKEPGKRTEEKDVPEELQREPIITDEEAMELARVVLTITEHYGDVRDVEWAIERGEDGKFKVWIVQARPVTTMKKDTGIIKEYEVRTEGKSPILSGIAIGNAAAAGEAMHVRVITGEAGQTFIMVTTMDDDGQIREHGPEAVKEGIHGLVAEITMPTLEPVMKKMKKTFMITEQGNRTGHAAIIAREQEIPTIVAAADALKVLALGMKVTLDNSKGGDAGYIYEGFLPIEVDEIHIGRVPDPKTPIRFIVSDPDNMYRIAVQYPFNDGVELLRKEFLDAKIMRDPTDPPGTARPGIHPRAITGYNRLLAEGEMEYRKAVTALKETSSALEGLLQKINSKEILLNEDNIKWFKHALKHLKEEIAYLEKGSFRQTNLQYSSHDLERGVLQVLGEIKNILTHWSLRKSAENVEKFTRAREEAAVIARMIDLPSKNIETALERYLIIKEIDRASRNAPDKEAWYETELARQYARAGTAFWGKPVKVRAPDYKANEYKDQVGGSLFEKKEENSMMGSRGQYRYIQPWFREAYRMEVKAFKKARGEWGYKNLQYFFPIVRTVEEAYLTIGLTALEYLKGEKLLGDWEPQILTELEKRLEIATHKEKWDALKKSQQSEYIKWFKDFAMAFKNYRKEHLNGLRLGAMIEVPSSTFLAEPLAEIFDFFSIGSNDLRQFTFAMDRDAGLEVFGESNEMASPILEQIQRTIEAAHKHDVVVGICGQGPSDIPVLGPKLVEMGIDSVGVAPDAAIRTKLLFAKAGGVKLHPELELYLRKELRLISIEDYRFIKKEIKKARLAGKEEKEVPSFPKISSYLGEEFSKVIGQLDGQHRKELEILDEVFQIEGSFAYEGEFRVEDGKAYLWTKVEEGTKVGLAEKWKSRSDGEFVKAGEHDPKANTIGKPAGERKIFVSSVDAARRGSDFEGRHSVIIPSGDGKKTIRFIGHFKEDYDYEKKVEFFKDKLDIIKRFASERGSENMQEIEEAFKAIPWTLLFEASSDFLFTKIIAPIIGLEIQASG